MLENISKFIFAIQSYYPIKGLLDTDEWPMTINSQHNLINSVEQNQLILNKIKVTRDKKINMFFIHKSLYAYVRSVNVYTFKDTVSTRLHDLDNLLRNLFSTYNLFRLLY